MSLAIHPRFFTNRTNNYSGISFSWLLTASRSGLAANQFRIFDGRQEWLFFIGCGLCFDSRDQAPGAPRPYALEQSAEHPVDCTTLICFYYCWTNLVDRKRVNSNDPFGL